MLPANIDPTIRQLRAESVFIVGRTNEQVQDGVEMTDEERSFLDTWLERASFRSQLTPATAAAAVRRILCYYIFDSRMSELQAIAVRWLKLLRFFRLKQLTVCFEIRKVK